MISPELLLQLVPNRDPDDDFPRDHRLSEIDPKSPEARIGTWANYLRHRITLEVAENKDLDKLLETSGFVGTGIFRVLGTTNVRSFEGFPIVSGLQFGAVLFRASRFETLDGNYIRGISMESNAIQAPLIQTLATFNAHAKLSPDGYVAAIYKDNFGNDCGITAAHVVNRYRIGQRVPVICSICGDSGRLAICAPGLIDAASITFPCGGPNSNYVSGNPIVRSAVEGETVEAHLGDTGKIICTVMQSLSTPSEIISAATPKHFLTDIHGHPGDSGSLISGKQYTNHQPALIGMYLGDASCEVKDGYFVTYGYGLDLQQAATILGANQLRGIFNV